MKYEIITNVECVKAPVKYLLLESRLFETCDNSNHTYDIDLFCYFSMPECWDDMLQCELCEEWLHMTCEGLKTALEGEWLCSVCRPPKSKRFRYC